MTSIKNKHVANLLAFLLFFLCFEAFTQNYGHEWIDYSRRHYKIPVYKEGIYRVDSAVLSGAFDLQTLDPRNLRLYLRGQEQRLYIRGETDGRFNSGDVLEFYANASTAAADSLIYHDISWIPNPYAPLFGDTIHAFLTDGGAPSVMRYQEESDTTFSAYPAAQYVYAQKLRAFNDSYNAVGEYDFGTSDPRYTQAEGYGNLRMKGGYNYLAFAGTSIYTTTPLPAWLTVAYSGNSREDKVDHEDHEALIVHTDQNNNTVVLSDTLFRGFVAVRQRFQISNANLSSSSDFSLISVANPSFSSFTNGTVIHYFHLHYPSPLNFGSLQQILFQPHNHPGSNKAYYKFSGLFLNNSSSVALYDLTDGRRIPAVLTSGGFFINAVIPNGSPNRQFFMVSDSMAIRVKNLKPAGENGLFTNYRAQLQTAGQPYLLVYSKKLNASAAQYRAYRESPAGGSFQVSLADVDQLYDQYCYGYTKHPLAIRNYLRHMNDSLSNKPTNVLLLGAATTPQSYSPYHPNNYLPTMGRPNSDNLLATGLSSPGHYEFHPELPIGRIAAFTNEEVTAYLDKVKEHEQVKQAEWKKNVLHFVGGDSPALSDELATYMGIYERIIEDTLYGGNVRSFIKNTSAPIEVVLSDSIKYCVNQGAGLLTFFGHGSPFGFDQSIDEPQLFNNKGRYPFLFANSCYSGDLHDPNAVTVSKRFVFARDRGSIGFLATTSLGFTWSLHNYASQFYAAMALSKYGQSIGAVIREAALQNSTSTEILTKFVSLDMTLHGDPAIKVDNGLQPDYTISNSDVQFKTDRSDSIDVSIVYRNIGKAVNDSMFVVLDRRFPGGDTAAAYARVKGAFFRDTIKLVMPVSGVKGVGLNYFRVTLDQQNEIAEANENNNTTAGFIEVFVPGNDIVPVYPYQFAVVPKTGTIVLKASTVDAFARSAGYRFVLDTCDRFIAPIASTLITSSGGVVEWPVTLPLRDSTVYYWKVSRDSVAGDPRVSWKESSFQTLGSERGWGQAHFNQFRDNGYQFVTYNEDLRRFVFENRLNTVNTRTGFHPWLPESQMTYFFNNQQMDAYSCTFNGWNFAVFDSITGEPVRVDNPSWPAHGSGVYGNCVCNHGKAYQYLYYFGRTNECGNPDPNWKTKMESFLNAIPQNNYVLGYTTGNPSGSPEMSTYSNSLYQAFESIGSGTIRAVPDTVAMVIFGRKGMTAGQASELVGKTRRTILYQQDSIRTKWNNGYISSPVIGPSYNWLSVHWDLRSLDQSPGDTTVLKVIGIRKDGTMDTLQTVSDNTRDLYAIDAFIDAKVYPYMKLVAYMDDNVYRTSPQLTRWQVLYREAPEAALNPKRVTSVGKDSLQEGEKVTFTFPIENIGSEPFTDSLIVSYALENNDRILVPLAEKRQAAPFTSGEILLDTLHIDSYRMAGNNAVWITVNPPTHARYQREQHYFNNVARVPFDVQSDQSNPLLDVTFDGRRILNGDIVSAKPTILVSLRDENKFLALDDTSAFTILLQGPGQSAPQRIYFGNGLQFIPANLPKNNASVIYQPTLTTDGRYTLVAQATDRSNNRSGSSDFRIQFEVNNKPMVTNVLNYPNPFTTSTRFVFTLTGSEVPEVFTIQILTVTGKVVKEITRGELGDLHIGRNITDYAWDGRDSYGDRLANGVYLYRVNTRLRGMSMEKMSSGADKYFNREYGKMVLVR